MTEHEREAYVVTGVVDDMGGYRHRIAHETDPEKKAWMTLPIHVPVHERVYLDRPTTLGEIGSAQHAISRDKGWRVVTEDDWKRSDYSLYVIPAKIALVHSELSEMLEAFRNADRENFEEEMADVILRLASIAHGFGVDLDAAVARKIEKNRERPYRHGGKRL